MRRVLGFTLIELMITMAVIAILAAIAYPSYQDYMRRAVRSKGQQYLMDLAQRQEQFLLDQRVYTSTIGAGGINLPVPAEITDKYQAATVTLNAGPPQTYVITLAPVGASIMVNDGTLVINNQQQRWREVSTPGTFVPKADANDLAAVGDCRWEEVRCVPH